MACISNVNDHIANLIQAAWSLFVPAVLGCRVLLSSLEGPVVVDDDNDGILEGLHRKLAQTFQVYQVFFQYVDKEKVISWNTNSMYHDIP